MSIDPLAHYVNVDGCACQDFHLHYSIRYNQVMMTNGSNDRKASDIRANAWMISMAPNITRPYLHLIRADRPIGTWLLLLPCLWSLSMASKGMDGGLPDPWYVLLFVFGAFVMRGAGCVINDLWDRDIDGKVARTSERPIASGVVSVRAAFTYLAGLLLLGLLVLIQFNMMAIVLGISSLALVTMYPLMKRITYWPQAFLGFTFNWGALLAWAAVTGSVDAAVVFLYGAGVLWTLGYDTVYGHQDKSDDLLAGVKSSSIKLGQHTQLFVAVVYILSLLLFTTAGLLAGMTWFFYLMLGISGLQFIWQVSTLKIDDPANCLTRFKSNRDVGLLIFLGALLG